MFHDVDVLDLMQLHRDIQVLEEYVVPGFVILLNNTQGLSGKNKLIVAIRKVVPLHKGN